MQRKVDEKGEYSCNGCGKAGKCELLAFQREKLGEGEALETWKKRPCPEWIGEK